MNKTDLIRAWKDPVYRSRLSREAAAGLPAHPSGVIELNDGQLKAATGALATTFRTCTMYPYCR
jgi:mersacidin/lichenicidin family type 2 lantibiotic